MIMNATTLAPAVELPSSFTEEGDASRKTVHTTDVDSHNVTSETASLATDARGDDEAEEQGSFDNALVVQRTEGVGKVASRSVVSNDTTTDTEAAATKELYLGLTGWKELEAGLPLILCTLSKSPVVFDENDPRTRRSESVARKPPRKKQSYSSSPKPATPVKKRKAVPAKKKTNPKAVKPIGKKQAKRINAPKKGSRRKNAKPDRKAAAMAKSYMKRQAHVEVTEEFPIVSLNKNDVLSGRGNNICQYPGNVRFRDIVNEFRERYINAMRQEKMGIAREVVARINKNGGRFVDKCENPPRNAWREMEDLKVMEKVSQALREKNRWVANKQGC